jgi:hypothetical protein
MKRFFYLVALCCLAGFGYCLTNWYSVPKTLGATLDAAADGDRSAIEDLKDPASLPDSGEAWLERMGWFLVGFGGAIYVARRVR